MNRSNKGCAAAPKSQQVQHDPTSCCPPITRNMILSFFRQFCHITMSSSHGLVSTASHSDQACPFDASSLTARSATRTSTCLSDRPSTFLACACQPACKGTATSNGSAAALPVHDRPFANSCSTYNTQTLSSTTTMGHDYRLPRTLDLGHWGQRAPPHLAHVLGQKQ